MDTIYCRKIAVTYGKIFSEVVNILQTNSYFPRTFFEIFAFFIIYPPRFCKLDFSELATKISRLRCNQRDAKLLFTPTEK